jgi:nitroimidazol reductase NimA-like FMN-containing flavoprotein (pyridoxamine 5'-phosphate oxidase superfamily)
MASKKKPAGPVASRPKFPPGHGIPKSADGLLPWSFVEERMAKARNYWVSTTRPDGRPHVRPVDGLWVDGAFCFGGDPKARWVRNLASNPAISVHLESLQEVVILEGTAEHVTDPQHPLAARVAEASREKYPEYYSGTPPFSPFWMMRPRVVFAWALKNFPRSATRFLLSGAPPKSAD